jgi:acyl-CoA thioester hydrolase
MNYQFSIPIQIRMVDLDPFAHVNNGIQYHYFDQGRGAYFAHLQQKPLNWAEMDLVLVHLETDFLFPILFNDSIICETKVVAIGNKSIKMSQQLQDIQTGQVKSRCLSILAGFDRKNQCSQPISEEYRKKIIAFEGELVENLFKN